MNARDCCQTALPLLVLLAGCSAPEVAYPVKRQYVISVTRENRTVPPAGAEAAKVRRFRVSPRFEGHGLVYRTGAVTYETDFYNEFLAAPAEMLTEETRDWLAAAGVFSNVVGAASRVAARYLFEGNVTALTGDFSEPEEPRAVMEIQFFLIDDAAARGSVAFHKTYRATRPLPSNRAEELVRGYNACLADILGALEADLRRALR
jgi:uncharacterized lipoprotein YmbA